MSEVKENERRGKSGHAGGCGREKESVCRSRGTSRGRVIAGVRASRLDARSRGPDHPEASGSADSPLPPPPLLSCTPLLFISLSLSLSLFFIHSPAPCTLLALGTPCLCPVFVALRCSCSLLLSSTPPPFALGFEKIQTGRARMTAPQKTGRNLEFSSFFLSED